MILAINCSEYAHIHLLPSTEHEHLVRVDRPDVTKKVSWAASLGDRSENADYHYNKKRLREIDNRIRYLCKCVDDLKVIDYHPNQEGKVMFGAWVEIKNEAKNLQNRFRIVGYEELLGNQTKLRRKRSASLPVPFRRAR